MNIIARVYNRLKRDLSALRAGSTANSVLATELAPFIANSAGSLRSRTPLALLSARQTPSLVLEVVRMLSPGREVGITPIESIAVGDDAMNAAGALAELFNQHGSDKSSYHNYHILYGCILGAIRLNELKVLEIGLGTNNPAIVSTMGKKGRPGASLRAFRDYLPRASLFGADIDRGVLFQEDRIRTFFVDQTRLASFQALANHVSNESFDLIIDDGLHSPDANLATMIFALKKLSRDGWFVIEDIAESSLDIWRLVSAILPEGYSSLIIRARGGFLFVLHKGNRCLSAHAPLQ